MQSLIEYTTKKTSLGTVLFAKYKSVVISMEDTGKTLDILFFNSYNEGNGEGQEALEIIKKDFPDKELVGSLPTPPMEHIYNKYGVKRGWGKYGVI